MLLEASYQLFLQAPEGPGGPITLSPGGAQRKHMLKPYHKSCIQCIKNDNISEYRSSLMFTHSFWLSAVVIWIFVSVR